MEADSAGIQDTLPTVLTGISDRFFSPPAREKFARSEEVRIGRLAASGKKRRPLSASANGTKTQEQQETERERNSHNKMMTRSVKENFVLRGILIPFDVRFYRGIARSYISFSLCRNAVNSMLDLLEELWVIEAGRRVSSPRRIYRWFDESQDYLRKCSNSSSAVEQSNCSGTLRLQLFQAKFVSWLLRDKTWEGEACIRYVKIFRHGARTIFHIYDAPRNSVSRQIRAPEFGTLVV